jgi:hypothetical protein
MPASVCVVHLIFNPTPVVIAMVEVRSASRGDSHVISGENRAVFSWTRLSRPTASLIDRVILMVVSIRLLRGPYEGQAS